MLRKLRSFLIKFSVNKKSFSSVCLQMTVFILHFITRVTKRRPQKIWIRLRDADSDRICHDQFCILKYRLHLITKGLKPWWGLFWYLSVALKPIVQSFAAQFLPFLSKHICQLKNTSVLFYNITVILCYKSILIFSKYNTGISITSQ